MNNTFPNEYAKAAHPAVLSHFRFLQDFKQKDKDMTAFFTGYDKSLAEIDIFIRSIVAYLMAPADPKRIAPVAAWNSFIPSQESESKKMKLLVEMREEAPLLVKDVMKCRDAYNALVDEILSHAGEFNKLLEQLQADPNDRVVKNMQVIASKAPGYDDRLQNSLAQSKEIQSRINRMIGTIRDLKSVN